MGATEEATALSVVIKLGSVFVVHMSLKMCLLEQSGFVQGLLSGGNEAVLF